MPNNDLDTLYAQIFLGRKADEFFRSELGGYVIGASSQDVAAAEAELRTVDPHDSKKIMELQNRVRTAEQALLWLNEALIAGRNAEQIIEEIEE